MSEIPVNVLLDDKLYAPTFQPHPKATEYGLDSVDTAFVPNEGTYLRRYDSRPSIPIQNLAKKKYAYLWQCLRSPRHQHHERSVSKMRYPKMCLLQDEFLTDRKFKEETPYVKLKNDIRSVFGDIENFMQDSEESLPSDQVDEVIEFCHGVCSDDLRSGVAAGGRYQRSWLDDRGYSHETGSGLSRRYTGNSLTPSQLYQILQARRYDNAVMPDADRRLIYITKMSPHYVLAITETAPWHEVESLRDALWKHLASQMSIKVILPQNFPIFHLEFHLPYLSLRQAPPEPHSPEANNGRAWTDLSFLEPEKGKLQHRGVFEAQISFVIVGSDNYRWDGYCFAFDDEEELLDDDSDAVRMDPISWNGKSCTYNANHPIWDPRKYFLAVFESRMTQPRNHTRDAKEDFERVHLTMRLLRRLMDILSEYTDAWETFSGYEGDLGYFSDIVAAGDHSSEQARHSIEVIRHAFVGLQRRRRELSRLEDWCKNSAQIFVNPIAVAAALFSMPETVKLNPKSFVVAIVVSMVLMRLLIYIPGFFGWWPAINARIRTAQWDGRASKNIATTQTRRGTDEATYDVEMHPRDNNTCNVDL
uniref:Uncharacterized protein n=1 Tax=Talaromyces marneffei PM1 TaxID=1077442 RepID=A0A093VLK9_TALMA